MTTRLPVLPMEICGKIMRLAAEMRPVEAGAWGNKWNSDIMHINQIYSMAIAAAELRGDFCKEEAEPPRKRRRVAGHTETTPRRITRVDTVVAHAQWVVRYFAPRVVMTGVVPSPWAATRKKDEGREFKCELFECVHVAHDEPALEEFDGYILTRIPNDYYGALYTKHAVTRVGGERTPVCMCRQLMSRYGWYEWESRTSVYCAFWDETGETKFSGEVRIS